MELLHVSLLLSRLFERLPEVWHTLVYGSLAGVTVFFLCVLFWKVSHSTESMLHGEQRTIWYPPTQWYRRWQQLSAEGRGKAPGWYPRFMLTTQMLSNWIGAFMMVMMGVICLGFAWAMGMPGAIMALLGAVFSFWFARFLVSGKVDEEERLQDQARADAARESKKDK